MPIGQENPVAWRRQMAGLFVIFTVVFILFRVLFGLSVISGPSMQDTLSDGDLVFFRRITYTPEHGDIVLVNCESRREVLVKRVIGLPGDVIEIDEKTASVYRNGKLLEEDYISTPTSSRANMTGPAVGALRAMRKVTLPSKRGPPAAVLRPVPGNRRKPRSWNGSGGKTTSTVCCAASRERNGTRKTRSSMPASARCRRLCGAS